MHPTEKNLRDEVRDCLGRLGTEVADAVVRDAVALVVSNVDPFFGFVLERLRSQPMQVICSAFHGVRVMVRVGVPIPGCLAFVSDHDPAKEYRVDYDLCWGALGPLFDDRDKVEVLRLVFGEITAILPSEHGRLELLAEISGDHASPSACSVWDLLRATPDRASIEEACKLIIQRRW